VWISKFLIHGPFLLCVKLVSFLLLVCFTSFLSSTSHFIYLLTFIKSSYFYIHTNALSNLIYQLLIHLNFLISHGIQHILCIFVYPSITKSSWPHDVMGKGLAKMVSYVPNLLLRCSAVTISITCCFFCASYTTLFFLFI
jgi:hypothetical protein